MKRQFSLRMWPGVYSKIKASSEEQGLSMNTEINRRLALSLHEDGILERISELMEFADGT